MADRLHRKGRTPLVRFVVDLFVQQAVQQNSQQIYNKSNSCITTSPQQSTKSYSLLHKSITNPQLIEPGIQRVQALADISRSALLS